MELKSGENGKKLTTNDSKRRSKMKGKKIGILTGICLLAVGIMLVASPAVAQDRPGQMIFGDVDMQAMGVENNVYPNANDAANIAAWATYGWDTPRGSAWFSGSNGDVNGDDIVDAADAALILRYSMFQTTTMPNSPVVLVPLSLTIYDGTPVTTPGNTVGGVLPGDTVDLLLEVQNAGANPLANAYVQYFLDTILAPPGVTMEGLGAGVTTNIWTNNIMTAVSTPGPSYGQIIVTVESDLLLTPPGSIAQINIICPGITVLSGGIPILGHRPVGVAPLVDAFFQIQYGAPTIVITDPVDGQTFCTSIADVTVTTVAAVGSTIALRVDGVTQYTHIIVGGDWGPTYATYTWVGVDFFITNPVDGPHSLLAAIDGQGVTSLPVNVIVDTTPPNVAITLPLDGATLCTTTVVVNGSCIDLGLGMATCVVDINGTTGDLSGGSATIVVPGTGVYTATLTGVDICGFGATTTISFSVDVTPPTVNITSPADGATFCTSSVTVTATFTDIGFGVVTAWLDVNGFSANIISGSATISGLTTGAYTATVTVTDACLVSSSTSIGFLVDVTPPTVSITLPTNGSTVCTSQVVVLGSCTDVGFGLAAVNGCVMAVGGLTADLSLGSATFSLADGYYTGTLTATDVCAVSSSTIVSFWVDTLPPIIAIIQPTLPPLVYDSLGTDIWGTIWDPSVCGPGAITYLTPTTAAMFGENPMEIGAGDVVRAQTGQTVVVPININASGIGPTSTFSYEIWVDFDDGALALSGPNSGVS